VARILVQIVINAVSLYVAGSLIGAQVPSDVGGLAIVAVVFGLLNAVVRPILNILTCPFYILTLGLFTLIMNVIILWLLERLTGLVSWGGFWNMLVAGIVVSIVSFLLNLVFGGKDANR
jgi:putative membrane protein